MFLLCFSSLRMSSTTGGKSLAEYCAAQAPTSPTFLAVVALSRHASKLWRQGSAAPSCFLQFPEGFGLMCGLLLACYPVSLRVKLSA